MNCTVLADFGSIEKAGRRNSVYRIKISKPFSFSANEGYHHHPHYIDFGSVLPYALLFYILNFLAINLCNIRKTLHLSITV
jgi:hypothetical protein